MAALLHGGGLVSVEEPGYILSRDSYGAVCGKFGIYATDRAIDCRGSECGC